MAEHLSLFAFIDKHVSLHYDFHIFLKNLKEGIGTFYESYPTHTRYIPAYCARRRHGDRA
ncbi:tryptophan halogenase [Bacillus sp. FW1]|nr:Tryptophan halogenase [Bacillus sp. FW1]GFM15546.1 tryptophan halogenase [Bacillus sp. FW1]